MKTLTLTILAGILWASAATAQQIVVGIRASVPETTEPSPTIRIRPGEFVITRESTATILDELRVRLEYGGTATPGLDYSELPQFVTIPAGAPSVALLVEARDDQDVESDETVIATLALPLITPAGYSIAPDRRQARVVIHDSDTPPPVERPEVRLTAARSRTGEPCPTCFVAPAVLVFERTGSTEHGLSVYFRTDGTATPELDYTPLPSHVEIPAGASQLEVQVVARDDQLAEGPEVVRVRLLEVPPTPISIPYRINPDQNTSLVVIFDDEPDAPKARLDIVSPQEGDHFPLGMTVEVSAIGVYTEGEIDQGVRFYDGDRLIGSTPALAVNRAPIPGLPSVHTIRWENPPAGTHTLTAISDLRPDGSVVSAPVHIQIGDQPSPRSVRIEATQRIAEETSIPFRRLRMNGQFTITRTGSTENPQNVWVLYSGTSTPEADYPALPMLVTIPAGTNAVEILVEANNDQLTEPIETLVATLSNCPPPPIKAPCYEFEIDPAHAQATVFLRDDGITQASLDIVRPEDEAHFEAGATIPIAVIAIDLEGYISRVEFWADNQLIGVSELAFFRAPDPGTPIRHEFEWRNAPAGEHVITARVPRENADALLSLPVHIVVGPPPSDQVVLEIVTTDPLGREPGANNLRDPAVFTVRRVAGLLNVDVRVNYVLQGTATNGEDYEALDGNLLLPAGERSIDLIIEPRADTVREEPESVLVRLAQPPCATPPPPGCYRVGEHGIAEALIVDRSEEHQMPRVVITRPAPHQQFANGENVEIRVEAVDPDGYVPRADFFADGQQIGSQVIDFFRAPDPGETQVFELLWEHPAPGPHRITVRVTDNDGLSGAAAVDILVGPSETVPLVALVVLDAFAREPFENSQTDNASFGIVRFGSSSDALEISYTLGGSASNGVDYAQLSGRVLLPAGAETAVVTIQPLADALAEGIETVAIRLNESSHYQLAASRHAQAIIADHNFPRANARCVPLADGSRYLCFAGESGQRFRIEASADLLTWQTIFDGQGVDEAVHFVDEGNGGLRCRFYRLVPEVPTNSAAASREEAIIRLELQREINNASSIPMPPLPPTPINPEPTETDPLE